MYTCTQSIWGELPWAAVLSGLQHSISSGVVDELFLFGIPLQFAAAFDGDEGELAERVGTYGGIDRGNRLTPVPDSIDEITVVIRTYR